MIPAKLPVMVKSIAWDLGVIRKPTHEEIAHAAFHLYLERGSVPGHEEEDWLRAQRLLIEKLNEPDPPPSRIPPGESDARSFTRHSVGNQSCTEFRTAMSASLDAGSLRPVSPFRPSSATVDRVGTFGRSVMSTDKE